MIEYKGYVGKIEYDDEAGIFHGEVINVRDVITFQGESAADLKKAFAESVDDYVSFCKSRGEEPEKPLSGKFVVRTSTEVHRKIHTAAKRAGKSLNTWVVEKLELASANDLQEPAHNTRACKSNVISLEFPESLVTEMSIAASTEGVSLEKYVSTIVNRGYDAKVVTRELEEVIGLIKKKLEEKVDDFSGFQQLMRGKKVVSVYDMHNNGEAYGKIALNH